jgi:hypothetical protein
LVFPLKGWTFGSSPFFPALFFIWLLVPFQTDGRRHGGFGSTGELPHSLSQRQQNVANGPHFAVSRLT